MNKLVYFALIACFMTATASAQNDAIFGKKGVPTRGQITAMSKDTVTINERGLPRKFEVRDILKVTFDGEPTELSTARNRILEGQYESGLEELNKIKGADVTLNAVKQDIAFYKALCKGRLAFRGGGDKGAAAAELLEFMRTGGQGSFHFLEAVELLGDLALALGNAEKAVTYYGLVGSVPWKPYQMKSAVLKGRALIASSKHAEAMAEYQKVLADGVNTPEAAVQKMHATVGTAVCEAATGKFNEGIKRVEDLIARNDPSDKALFARAYNALGACYFNADKPKDAALAYLHTDLMFFVDADAHAEALYYLNKIWSKLNKSDRAVRAINTLRSRYPGSRWAAMQ